MSLHVKRLTPADFGNVENLVTNGQKISTPIIITDESDDDGTADHRNDYNEAKKKEDYEFVENSPTIFVVDSEGTAFIRRKGTVEHCPPDLPGERLVSQISEMVRSKSVDTDLIRTLLEHLGGDDLTGILADLVTDKELDMIVRQKEEKRIGTGDGPDGASGPPVTVPTQTLSVSSGAVISNIIENELLKEKEANEEVAAEESSMGEIVEPKDTDTENDDIIIPRLSPDDTMDDLVDSEVEEGERSAGIRLTDIASLLADPVAKSAPENIINIVDQAVYEDDDEIEIISAMVNNRTTASADPSPKTSPPLAHSIQSLPSAAHQTSPASLPLMPDLASLVQPNFTNLSLPSDQVLRSLLYPVTEDNPLLQLSTCHNPWNLPPDLAVYEELLRTRLATTLDSTEYGRLAAQYEELIRVCRQRQRRAVESGGLHSTATLVPMVATRTETGPATLVPVNTRGETGPPTLVPVNPRSEHGPATLVPLNPRTETGIVTLVPVNTRSEHGPATLVPVSQTMESRLHTRQGQGPATLVPVNTRSDWVPFRDWAPAVDTVLKTLVPVSQTRAPVIVSTRSLGPTVRLEKVSHNSKDEPSFKATNRKQTTEKTTSRQKGNQRSLSPIPRTPTLRQRKQKVVYQDPDSPEESTSSSSDDSETSVHGRDTRGIKRGLTQEEIIEELSDNKRNKNLGKVGELYSSGFDNNMEEVNEITLENNQNNVSQFLRNKISDSSEDLDDNVGVKVRSNNHQHNRNKRKVKRTFKRRKSSSSESSDSDDHSASAKRKRAFQAFKEVRSHGSQNKVDAGKISCRPTTSDVEEDREGETSRIRRSLDFRNNGGGAVQRSKPRKNVLKSDSDTSWKADEYSEDEEDESDNSFIVDENNHQEGSHGVAAEAGGVWSEGGWSEIIDGLKRKSEKYQELTGNYEESLNCRQLGGYDQSDEDGDKENKYPPRLLENLREAVREAMEDNKELNSAPFDDNDLLIQHWQLYDVQENSELKGECICGRTGLRWLYFMRIRSAADWRFHTRIVGSECIRWFCRSKPNSILTCVSRLLKEGCVVTFRSRLDSGLLLFSLGGTTLPPFMRENQELHSTEYITPGVSVREDTGEVDIAVRPGTRDRIKDTAGNILVKEKKYQAWLKPLIKPSKEQNVPVMEFVLVRIDDLTCGRGQVGPKAHTAKDFIK